MRVVREQRSSTLGEDSGDGPVIGALAPGYRRKINPRVATHEIAQQLGSEARVVHARSGIELDGWIERQQPRRTFSSDQGNELGVEELALCVAGHGKSCQAHQAVLRLRGLGDEASKPEFHRQAGAVGSKTVADVLVDAGGESFQDRARVTSVARIFRLDGTAVAKQAGIDIALQKLGAEDFC